MMGQLLFYLLILRNLSLCWETAGLQKGMLIHAAFKETQPLKTNAALLSRTNDSGEKCGAAPLSF